MPLLRTPGSARQRVADASMRVSDAERAEVADQLAQHYGDGRLDQADLDERLSRAMSAKTRADLAGLTADLPDVETRPAARASYPARARAAAGPAPRSRRQWPTVLPMVLLIVVLMSAWHGLAPGFPWVPFWPLSWFGSWFWFGPSWWLWIALLAFCWVRFRPRRRR